MYPTTLKIEKGAFTRAFYERKKQLNGWREKGGGIIDHVVMCWLPFDLNSSA